MHDEDVEDEYGAGEHPEYPYQPGYYEPYGPSGGGRQDAHKNHERTPSNLRCHHDELLLLTLNPMVGSSRIHTQKGNSRGAAKAALVSTRFNVISLNLPP